MMSSAKGKRSEIWFHFLENDDKSGAWCRHCSKLLSTKSNSFGNLSRHMKIKHSNITLSLERRSGASELLPEEDDTTPQVAPSISAPEFSNFHILRADPVHPRNSEKQSQATNSSNKPLSSLKVEKINIQLINMLAKGCHSIHILEETEFIKLIEMVRGNPGYELPSRKTLMNTLLPILYTEVFEKVKLGLNEAIAVCLSTNSWTASTTGKSYIAVTAHFIDKNTKLCSYFLDCIQSTKNYKKDYLIEFLRHTILEWQLSDKVSCIVSEHSRDILLGALPGEWRTIDCFHHYFNLSMQAGLNKVSETIDKVKTVVGYFKKSSLALSKLKEILNEKDQPYFKLIQECKTQWSSCYVMLEHVLKMKEAVIRTLELLNKDLLMESQDWDIIETIIPILNPFYEISNEMGSENYVTLSKVLIISQLMTKLVVKFSSVSYEHEEITDMLRIIGMEIKARFHNLEQNQLYADCALLDPRFKSKGFRTTEAYERAVKSLKFRICEIELNVQNNDLTNTQLYVETTIESIWNDFDLEMSQIKSPENPVPAKMLEVDKYLKEGYLNRKEDLLQWWDSRKPIYPHLYQYALKRLCIQATAVPCKRVLSGAGQLLNERRALLKTNRVSELMFLQSNV